MWLRISWLQDRSRETPEAPGASSDPFRRGEHEISVAMPTSGDLSELNERTGGLARKRDLLRDKLSSQSPALHD